MTETAKTIHFLREKWKELGKNKEISNALVAESTKKENISKGGGILWVKYNSKDLDSELTWTFVGRNDMSNGKSIWSEIPKIIPNFEKISVDYDPSKHCLILLTVPHTSEQMFGQMVRINYNSKGEVANFQEEIQNFQEDSEGIWNFRL